MDQPRPEVCKWRCRKCRGQCRGSQGRPACPNSHLANASSARAQGIAPPRDPVLSPGLWGPREYAWQPQTQAGGGEASLCSGSPSKEAQAPVSLLCLCLAQGCRPALTIPDVAEHLFQMESKNGLFFLRSLPANCQ